MVISRFRGTEERGEGQGVWEFRLGRRNPPSSNEADHKTVGDCPSTYSQQYGEEATVHLGPIEYQRHTCSPHKQ